MARQVGGVAQVSGVEARLRTVPPVSAETDRPQLPMCPRPARFIVTTMTSGIVLRWPRQPHTIRQYGGTSQVLH